MNLPNKHAAVSFAAAFAVGLSLLYPISAAATTAKTTTPTSYAYTRLFYSQRGVNAKQSFLFHADSIDIYAPQSYKLDANGALTGSVDPDLLAFAKTKHIKIMPLITNGNFSQSSYKGLLGNPTAEDAAAAAMIAEAKKYGYDGWQIDFEQMDASYKDKFSEFISRLYAALKPQGLTFSVAVIAKVSDKPVDYPNNLWQTLVAAYDYDAIAANTDFVSIMSYDDPMSNGPVVEYYWLKEVIDYSVAHIPKNKISLGIPFYYWKWNDVTGERLSVGGASSFKDIQKKYKTKDHYDTESQEPYLTYKVDGQGITLWYENAKSIAKKVALVKQYGLMGTSAWALGLENEDVWNSLKK